MQNQAAVEALYSATFVEDYLDCVENLPNDLQRHLSRLREFDLTQYTEFLRDLGSLVSAFEKETTASGQRLILAKIQHGLIAAQDIGDDKLATVQAMSDMIENKTRQLEHDSKNLDFGQEEKEESQTPVPATTTTTTTPANQNSKHTPVQKPAKKQQAHVEEKSEKQPIKRRKKLLEKSWKEDRSDRGGGSAPTEDDEVGSSVEKSISSKSSSGNNVTPKSRSAFNASKKVVATPVSTVSVPAKRKQTKRAAAAMAAAANVVDKDDSDHDDVDLSNIEIDPDEPTYCLCDQISYGEMIGCDNDLCPIEWFHFSCVQLTNKPKGKWFCPKCRGDKPTTMKPKAQFLKELEKYNKEREEKSTKQTG